MSGLKRNCQQKMEISCGIDLNKHLRQQNSKIFASLWLAVMELTFQGCMGQIRYQPNEMNNKQNLIDPSNTDNNI